MKLTLATIFATIFFAVLSSASPIPQVAQREALPEVYERCSPSEGGDCIGY
ncbi:hypothetical protein SCP_0504910 [Sparassis crispa]|uniref:Uncharacterized protein n=1 Tax=Sparassis crispa TaxID=139825 RepID=A0A401GMM9_9APHY|nr:hypothetical protein SCP_0504910 [Sparassis crispa]GBE83442.1 hypothetical protein SCP_0504910 [Sparassis crispa]